MNKYFKLEFRRAILSRNALISFIITILAFLIAFLDCILYWQEGLHGLDHLFDASSIFIRTRYMNSSSYLFVIAPILATMIFSDSYLLDKESGFLKSIYVRMSKRKYIFTKIMVNSIVSGLVIALASAIVLIILIKMYGIRDVHMQSGLGAFSFIFYKSRILYCVFLILISFIFNAIFATLALGISPWIKNRYLAMLAPFFYYIIAVPLFPAWMSPITLFSLEGVLNESQIIIYQLILLFIGVISFYYGVKYDYEKNL
ncbi:hypothetical protein CLOHAE12215_00089 [Clostridium haemolyticum]|uniref:hypothetical protein n=1 Tax=Clostridium haemolyticum TaxID=84025 RepID=UPI001C3A22F8|nr:hypothetical protein [Clostridium haemolyticum]CAG7838742.1 hypothetical protein CLOHAE12215_00089 [Clostridium haemolyticum]